MNSDNDDRPPAPEPKPGSPAAWIIGLVFIMAVLGILLVHSGRDINSGRTTADPNTAPNVVTGSNTSRK
jgi:hypothetical protein